MQAVNVDVEVSNKQSLGLTFLKPVNDSNRGIVINSVTKGGQCDGKVLKGDEIIYIDGVALHNITTINDFIKLFKKSSKGKSAEIPQMLGAISECLIAPAFNYH